MASARRARAPARPRGELPAPEALSAQRATVVAAAVVCVGQLAFVLIDLTVLDDAALASARAAHALLALATAVALARRRAPPVALSVAAFVALALPLIPIFWWAESAVAEAGLLWEPLIGFKLLLVGVALLTPHSIALAAGLIVIFAVEAFLVYRFVDMGAHPLALTAGEPWVTLVYCLIAAALLVYRRQTRVMGERLIEARAEAEVLHRLAETSLAVRDLVNTPLQSLELAVGALEARHPEERPTLARMRRAIARLSELGHVLSVWESASRAAQARDLDETGAALAGRAPRR